MARDAARDRTAAPRSPGSPSSDGPIARLLIVTVCPREPGAVVLAVRRGGRARRLTAPDVVQALRDVVMERRLDEYVRVCEGCAGGCAQSGPNVSVTVYQAPRPDEKPCYVAIDWKTYVYSLASLDCVATIIDENLRPSG